MAKGKKTGGRVAGTPNKDNQSIMDKLAELECDPLEGMAIIAREAMAADSGILQNSSCSTRGRKHDFI